MPDPTYEIPGTACYEVQFKGEEEGNQGLNVLHYATTSSTAIPDGKAFVDSIAAYIAGSSGITPKYRACMSENYALTELRIQVIHPTRFIIQRYPIPVGQGTVESAPLPPGADAVITKKGAQGGRKNRGSFHIQGFPWAWQSAGKVDFVVAAAPMLALASAITSDIVVSSVTLKPIIYHRTAWLLSPNAYFSQIETTIRTMSRRVVGRGI